MSISESFRYKVMLRDKRDLDALRERITDPLPIYTDAFIFELEKTILESSFSLEEQYELINQVAHFQKIKSDPMRLFSSRNDVTQFKEMLKTLQADILVGRLRSSGEDTFKMRTAEEIYTIFLKWRYVNEIRESIYSVLRLYTAGVPHRSVRLLSKRENWKSRASDRGSIQKQWAKYKPLFEQSKAVNSPRLPGKTDVFLMLKREFFSGQSMEFSNYLNKAESPLRLLLALPEIFDNLGEVKESQSKLLHEVDTLFSEFSDLVHTIQYFKPSRIALKAVLSSDENDLWTGIVSDLTTHMTHIYTCLEKAFDWIVLWMDQYTEFATKADSELSQFLNKIERKISIEAPQYEASFSDIIKILTADHKLKGLVDLINLQVRLETQKTRVLLPTPKKHSRVVPVSESDSVQDNTERHSENTRPATTPNEENAVDSGNQPMPIETISTHIPGVLLNLESEYRSMTFPEALPSAPQSITNEEDLLDVISDDSDTSFTDQEKAFFNSMYRDFLQETSQKK